MVHEECKGCGSTIFHVIRTTQVNGNDDTIEVVCAVCGKWLIGEMADEDEERDCCDGCKEPFSEDSVGGGRCTSCGRMIT